MQLIRHQFTTALMTVIALTAGGAILAQTSTSKPGGGRLDFLAGYLSLTDAQKTQAQSIFDAASTASATAQGQLTAARTSLQTAIKANAADSQLDSLAAAAGVIEGQLEGIQAKASAKFYALLTADQKTKYDALGAHQGGGGPGQHGFRSRSF